MSLRNTIFLQLNVSIWRSSSATNTLETKPSLNRKGWKLGCFFLSIFANEDLQVKSLQLLRKCIGEVHLLFSMYTANNPYHFIPKNTYTCTNVYHVISGYKGQCGTYSSLIGKSQFRCEMGDLAGKHGQLSIGPYNDANRPTYIFYDDTLRLSGSESGKPL